MRKQVLVNKAEGKYWSVEDKGTHREVTWGKYGFEWTQEWGSHSSQQSYDDLLKHKLFKGAYTKVIEVS
jgi:hypothetical protein